MRTLVLLLLISLAWPVSTPAQSGYANANLELPRPAKDRTGAVSPLVLTRELGSTLGLKDSQYLRLQLLNQRRLAQQDAIQWRYADDPAECRQQLLELEARYRKECRRLLSPQQLSDYIQAQQPAPEATPSAADDKLG